MQTILLIDDDDCLVDNLRELLEEEGYRVVSAGNGMEGVDRALAETPDLVLTDFMMPVANGRELVLALRAMPDFRSTPIVMMTSSLKSVALSDGNGGTLEVSAFLAKPASWEAILATVLSVLGRG